MATPALLKVKVFWNKVYYDIYSVYNVTNKTLQFGNSTICIKEVIITSVLWRFDQKDHFFKG